MPKLILMTLMAFSLVACSSTSYSRSDRAVMGGAIGLGAGAATGNAGGAIAGGAIGALLGAITY